MTQQSAFPLLVPCKNPKCSNLVSNVAERTRAKEFCTIECRNKFNNSKPRGIHSAHPKQYFCEECHLPVLSNVGQKSIPKRFCEDCKVIRLRRKSLERYHRSKLR